MMKGRQIARLACLRATYSFQRKESAVAIADLAATVSMGRHIGSRGPFIATLVQFAIEHSAITVAAAFLPQQNAQTLKELEACLQIPPQSSPLRQAILGEKQFLLQHTRPQYEGKSIQEAMELLRKNGLCTKEEIDLIAKVAGGAINGLLKQIDEAALLYEELARISLLPRTEFSQAITAFQKKYAQLNALAAGVAPGVEAVRYAADRVSVRFTMLHAAAAVVFGGFGKLQAFKDPFGDGPFEYRPFKGGFELKSKLHGKDRAPAIVRVGLQALN